MLEQVSYSPILHTRVSEMRALLQLPAATKDKILPIMVARPWPNSLNLARTWEKISEAIGERLFGVDLDRTKLGAPGKQPASTDFDALFDERDGHRAFYDLVESLPRAIPVLRRGQIEAQAERVRDIDRGAMLRLERNRDIDWRSIVDAAYRSVDDLVLIIDTGWSSDFLNKETWAAAIVAHVTSTRPETEIIVSGSSFPDDFASIGARGARPVIERTLFQNLVRRYNAAVLTYGDWGSTRPPNDPTPMRSVPRLDLPTAGEWIHFRRSLEDDEEEDYRDIASRVVSDAAWPADQNIWGTYSIACTAENLPGAIRSPSVAASVRINIHMHLQSFFGLPDVVSDSDEPYTD